MFFRHLNLEPLCAFYWILDDTVIQGNDIADRLANARRNNLACCHNTLARRDIIRLCKTIIANSYGYWVSSGRSLLRTIKITTPPLTDHPLHQDQRNLSRLRIGHTRLTHTFLLQKSSPTLCSFCGVDITVHLILTESHGYTAERITCKLDHCLLTRQLLPA